MPKGVYDRSKKNKKNEKTEAVETPAASAQVESKITKGVRVKKEKLAAKNFEQVGADVISDKPSNSEITVAGHNTNVAWQAVEKVMAILTTASTTRLTLSTAQADGETLRIIDKLIANCAVHLNNLREVLPGAVKYEVGIKPSVHVEQEPVAAPAPAPDASRQRLSRKELEEKARPPLPPAPAIGTMVPQIAAGAPAVPTLPVFPPAPVVPQRS